jgi:hypothetical protein
MKNKIQKFFFAICLLLLTGGLQSFAPNNSGINSSAEVMGGAYLVFAEKFGGTVTHEHLKNTTEIGVEGCAKGSKIIQFVLTITKGGKQSSHQGTSCQLTKEMLVDLRSLSVGDEFIFKKVKAYLPDGKSTVDVWGKKFTVV